MPGKIKLIQIAEPPKRNPFIRAAAGVLLSGVLAASCAPELVHLESKNAISVTAAQPEKVAPGWKAFCEKHNLTDKEKAALSKLFLLEHDKTGFRHSDVFETLVKNANARKNYMGSATRLISSVLQRSECVDNAKNSLNAVSVFLRNNKLGRVEFDTVLKIVENDPTMNPEKISAVYDAAFTFSNENYSPEFSKMFQKFFFGDLVSSYLSWKEMKMIIESFHSLAINDSYSPEMLETISETLDYFSERVPELVRKNAEAYKKEYGGNFHPLFLYHGPNSKDAAYALLAALSNPNLNPQMLEDLRFELRFTISPENEGAYYGKSVVEGLAKTYSISRFGAEASAKLRVRVSKKKGGYDLDNFLDSLILIANGRNFGKYETHAFLSAYGELERAESVLGERNSSDLGQAASVIASPRYSARVSEFLFSTLRRCRGDSLSAALQGISALLENKEYSPELAEKLEKAYLRLSRLQDYADSRTNAFSEVSEILEKTKESANGLNNMEFVLSQKGVDEKPMLSLISVLLDRSSLPNDPLLPAKLEKAREFAKRIGAKHKDAEICLNFAYALEQIGEEKTEKLYREAHMEYFGRYSKELLLELHSCLSPQYSAGSPVLLAVYNKADWNGSFYTDSGFLEGFTKYYKIALVETDREQGIYDALEDIFMRVVLPPTTRGIRHASKVDTLILAGHGSPQGISFGDGGNRSYLSSSDRSKLRQMREYFVENPTVILISCSTGKNEQSVGAVISRSIGARLLAPKEPGNIWSASFDEEGRVTSVKYSVEHSEFESGKMKKEEKK